MEKMHNMIAAVGAVTFLWFSLPFVLRGIINIGNITGMLLAGLVLSYAVSYEKVRQGVQALWQHAVGRAGLILLAVVAALVLVTVAVETVCMVRAAGKHPPKNTTAESKPHFKGASGCRVCVSDGKPRGLLCALRRSGRGRAHQ
mgnify:CR=1 FL=1